MINETIVKLLLSSHILFLGAVHLWRISIDFEATKWKKSGSIQIFQRNNNITGA